MALGTRIFTDLAKKRTTTPSVSVNYGAKYPVSKVIVYNQFNNDSKEFPKYESFGLLTLNFIFSEI